MIRQKAGSFALARRGPVRIRQRAAGAPSELSRAHRRLNVDARRRGNRNMKLHRCHVFRPGSDKGCDCDAMSAAVDPGPPLKPHKGNHHEIESSVCNCHVGHARFSRCPRRRCGCARIHKGLPGQSNSRRRHGRGRSSDAQPQYRTGRVPGGGAHPFERGTGVRAVASCRRPPPWQDTVRRSQFDLSPVLLCRGRSGCLWARPHRRTPMAGISLPSAVWTSPHASGRSVQHVMQVISLSA